VQNRLSLNKIVVLFWTKSTAKIRIRPSAALKDPAFSHNCGIKPPLPMAAPKSLYRSGENQTSWKKKYETRISKSETNIKFECPNVQNGQNKTMRAVHPIDQRANAILRIGTKVVLVIEIYVIRICLVLRASDFGFKSLH